MPERKWQWFAKQIEEERNPIRIGKLAKELNEAMLTEEREKVRNRLKRLHQTPDESLIPSVPTSDIDLSPRPDRRMFPYKFNSAIEER